MQPEELKARGTLSEEEFQRAKTRLLGSGKLSRAWVDAQQFQMQYHLSEFEPRPGQLLSAQYSGPYNIGGGALLGAGFAVLPRRYR